MDGQDGETIVPAECTEDGIDLGIDKASTGDTGLKVIQPDHLHAASKVVKSILDTANESLQVLPPDDFFIGVTRVAQNGLEHVGTAVTTRFGASQGSLAKVDLHVLTRWSFHPRKDSWTLGFQLSTEPLDGVVSSIETMLEDQVLPDPLGLQSLQEFLLNLLPKGFTEAMQTRGPLWPVLNLARDHTWRWSPDGLPSLARSPGTTSPASVTPKPFASSPFSKSSPSAHPNLDAQMVP